MALCMSSVHLIILTMTPSPPSRRPGPGPALRLNKVSGEITHHGAARAWADSGNYAANERTIPLTGPAAMRCRTQGRVQICAEVTPAHGDKLDSVDKMDKLEVSWLVTAW